MKYLYCLILLTGFLDLYSKEISFPNQVLDSNSTYSDDSTFFVRIKVVNKHILPIQYAAISLGSFGNYEKVERSDGEEVSVAKLLEIAKESAFNALLKGFDGDDFTKFYIGWLQLYSFAESEFDDAAKFSRVGLSINVAELFTEHILIKHGNKQTLGSFEERINANKNIGDRANNFLIDLVHRSMALYKGNNRTALLQYIGKVAAQPENSFWRVITSLCEVLPNGSEDHKQALGLLTNKDSLIRESKTVQATATIQKTLFE